MQAQHNKKKKKKQVYKQDRNKKTRTETILEREIAPKIVSGLYESKKEKARFLAEQT